MCAYPHSELLEVRPRLQNRNSGIEFRIQFKIPFNNGNFRKILNHLYYGDFDQKYTTEKVLFLKWKKN